MITAIDTNVLVALWDLDNVLNSAVQSALDAALAQGKLVITGTVFAELLAFPRRNESFIDNFLRQTGIAVDWATDEIIWRAAGRAFHGYAKRRRKHGNDSPRRLLADFLIGAHAMERRYPLLTLDAGIYRGAFPALRIVRI